jgi:hypothetical protein
LNPTNHRCRQLSSSCSRLLLQGTGRICAEHAGRNLRCTVLPLWAVHWERSALCSGQVCVCTIGLCILRLRAEHSVHSMHWGLQLHCVHTVWISGVCSVHCALRLAAFLLQCAAALCGAWKAVSAVHRAQLELCIEGGVHWCICMAPAPLDASAPP